VFAAPIWRVVYSDELAGQYDDDEEHNDEKLTGHGPELVEMTVLH
jgi:hypothetical protein